MQAAPRQRGGHRPSEVCGRAESEEAWPLQASDSPRKCAELLQSYWSLVTIDIPPSLNASRHCAPPLSLCLADSRIREDVEEGDGIRSRVSQNLRPKRPPPNPPKNTNPQTCDAVNHGAHMVQEYRCFKKQNALKAWSSILRSVRLDWDLRSEPRPLVLLLKFQCHSAESLQRTLRKTTDLQNLKIKISTL